MDTHCSVIMIEKSGMVSDTSRKACLRKEPVNQFCCQLQKNKTMDQTIGHLRKQKTYLVNIPSLQSVACCFQISFSKKVICRNWKLKRNALHERFMEQLFGRFANPQPIYKPIVCSAKHRICARHTHLSSPHLLHTLSKYK